MSKTFFDPKLPLIVIRAYVKKKGERMLRLALDTGCSRTIIPYEIAIALGCNPSAALQHTRIITGSGVVIAPVVTLKSIRTLGKIVRNLDVACHDLPEEGFVDGLLGIDFLKNFDLSIKFRKGIIELKKR